jgi:hypothetical protein
VNHCRGHWVAGGFRHGGQDSLRYLGARKPDRLLLAGWVVSRFGQGLVKHRLSSFSREDNQDKESLASDKGILIYVFVLCILRNM